MNKDHNRPGKVLLDGQAANNLLQMLEEAKAGENGQFVQLTPSKLASWIVSRYRQSAFKRDRVAIRKAHFNHQKHLKEAIKMATTEEELRATLAAAMKQVGRVRKRKVAEKA